MKEVLYDFPSRNEFRRREDDAFLIKFRRYAVAAGGVASDVHVMGQGSHEPLQLLITKIRGDHYDIVQVNAPAVSMIHDQCVARLEFVHAVLTNGIGHHP